MVAHIISPPDITPASFSKLNTNSGVTMTTYNEAFQMALASNVVVAVGNETACAGLALTKWATENIEKLDEDAKRLVSHVVDHLQTIQSIAEVMDSHYTEKIDAFDDENPGKVIAISRELSENELIKKLQELAGMSPEKVDEIKTRNLAEEAQAN